MPVKKRETCDTKRAVAEPARAPRAGARRGGTRARARRGNRAAPRGGIGTAGSRSRTVRMSRRSASNMSAPPAQPVARGGRATASATTSAACLRSSGSPSSARSTSSGLRCCRSSTGRSATSSLTALAAAMVGPQPYAWNRASVDPPVPHPQEDPGEVAAPGVLPLAHRVRLPHHPGVARVQEVVDERRAVSHAAPAGTRLAQLPDERLDRVDHVVDVLGGRRPAERRAHRAHRPVERHAHRDEHVGRLHVARRARRARGHRDALAGRGRARSTPTPRAGSRCSPCPAAARSDGR